MAAKEEFVLVVYAAGHYQIFGDICEGKVIQFLRAETLLNSTPEELVDDGPFGVWTNSFKINTKYWPAKDLGNEMLRSAKEAYAKALSSREETHVPDKWTRPHLKRVDSIPREKSAKCDVFVVPHIMVSSYTPRSELLVCRGKDKK